MSNFLLELISEEIPAFLQESAADKLAQSLETEFSDINLKATKVFAGVRRIAVLATVDSKTKAQTIEERGPKTTAPPQAKEKFSEKHNIDPSALTEKDGYWYLEKHLPETLASDVLSERLPVLIWNFKWSKMLRWGKSQFQWIRPLRQIVCLLDDKVVPFSLARGDDDGNGIKSGSISSAIHPRNNSPVKISSATNWENDLKKVGVIAFRPDRLKQIEKQTQDILKKHNLKVNLSEFGAAKLNNELAGLTEDPTIYLGTIDKSFMELPTEVRDISMRAHQRYIPLSDTNGESVPFFLFAANGTFPDNGKNVIAGNESVLTARLEDARHFWNTDRKVKLENRLKHLSNMSFHTSLGSQKERAERLEKLAGAVADLFGLITYTEASRAGLLAKADLQSQMVGEFPELQGIMGSYYAEKDHEDDAVCDALRSQYSGTPPDESPTSNVQAALAIADRIDTLVGFFGKDMKPSGSKDPYALRRKGNEVLSWATVIENKTKKSINLDFLIGLSIFSFRDDNGIEINEEETARSLNLFFNERLYQFLPTNRKDLITALFPSGIRFNGNQPLLTEQASKVEILEKFLETAEGEKLVQSFKRLANILENDKEKVSSDLLNAKLFEDPTENALSDALNKTIESVKEEDFGSKLHMLTNLCDPLDNFFEKVMVFDKNEKVRHNRVSLLKTAQETILSIVDLSKIQQS